LVWEDHRPERPGELAALLEASERTPAWIDGWLTAFAVAPVLVSTEAWLHPLFEGVPWPSLAEVERFMQLVSQRSHAIDVETADAVSARARLAAYGADERRHWAAGFSAFVASVPAAWRKRGRRKDDPRVITLIGDAATRGLDDSHLALVGDWLARRRAARG
jgi:hypothetical protein